jgi:hypothetical protein
MGYQVIKFHDFNSRVKGLNEDMGHFLSEKHQLHQDVF